MATKKRRKKSSSILPLKTFQLPVALVIMGLTCIGASFYVGHSNAEAPDGPDQTSTQNTNAVNQDNNSSSNVQQSSGGPEDPEGNGDNPTDKSKKAKKVTVCNHYVKVDNLNGKNGKPKDKQMNFVLKSTGQGGTATVTGKAGKGCIGKKAILAVYKAPGGSSTTNNLSFQKKQVLFSSAVTKMTKDKFTMTANIPSCFYQIDVAYRKSNQPLSTAEKAQGKTYHKAGGFTWGARGGSKPCGPVTPGQNPGPTPSPAPGAPPSGTGGEVPTSEPGSILPATGDTNLTLFGIAAITAGLVLGLYRRRKLTRR